MVESTFNKNDIISNIIKGEYDNIELNELYAIIGMQPELIKYIKNPSEELQFIAIIKNPYVYDLINNPSINVTKSYLDYILERQSLKLNLIGSLLSATLSLCGILNKLKSTEKINKLIRKVRV